jgi:hypothetical protein
MSWTKWSSRFRKSELSLKGYETFRSVICQMNPKYEFFRHHELIISVIERAVHGELIHPVTGKVIRNIMIMMPLGTERVSWRRDLRRPGFCRSSRVAGRRL